MAPGRSLAHGAIGSGGLGWLCDVTIYDQAGALMTTEKRPNAHGGMDLIVMIKKAIKDEIAGDIAGGAVSVTQALVGRYPMLKEY